MSRGFISYASSDGGFVKKLAADLKAHGFEVSSAVKIPAGQQADSVSKAIEKADFILVAVSPDYLQPSGGVVEVSVFCETNQEAIVIPVFVSPCESIGIYAGEKYADFTCGYELGLNCLISLLRPKRQMQGLSLLAMEPGQGRRTAGKFYSCFLSHSSGDAEFARRLHADLQDSGIRCFFAPEDMKIRRPIRRPDRRFHTRVRQAVTCAIRALGTQ